MLEEPSPFAIIGIFGEKLLLIRNIVLHDCIDVILSVAFRNYGIEILLIKYKSGVDKNIPTDCICK